MIFIKVVADIEFANNLNKLLKNPPKDILGKINVSYSPDLEMGEKIELVALLGQNVEAVRSFINGLGGEFEDLGYGFAILKVELKDLVEIVKNKDIQYLEIPKELYVTDEQSNSASCVQSARNQYGLFGEGTVIGFIDTGIDYTHPAFINEDGTTRIDYIYDLSLGGAIYNKELINEALKSNDPYSVVPSYDNVEHGTHVAGIACAGGQINKNYYGVAPKSSIMMVKSGRGLFSLSTNIMRGIKFLIDKGRELNKPLTINISLSTNDGAHNGTSLLEQYISTIATLDRVTIVIAAGNEGDAYHHVGGNLQQENNIKFQVSGDETVVIINLYKSVLPAISIELITPTGKSTGQIVAEEGFNEGVLSGNVYQIYNSGPKPFDITGEIVISLINRGNYILSGQWTIILRVLNDYNGNFDMWLPISEGLNKNTKFLTPTIDGTLGIPATVNNVISVGSYNYITRNISSFSGRGRSVPLYMESKPDIVAPGEGIISSIPNKSFDKKSGTSMAAPHVSGISALMMEWGIIKGNDPYLFGERLKYYLIVGSKKGRRDIDYPDTSWGYGEVCLYDSLSYLSEVLNIITQSAPEFRQETQKYNTIRGYLDQFNDSSTVLGYLVEYSNRDRFLELNNLENTTAVIINESYGIVYTPINQIPIVKQYVKNIAKTDLIQLNTLNSIQPIDASNAIQYHTNPYLRLNGTGVLLAIIDTGIDYLNEEFQKEDNTTRIISIWDQTIDSGKEIYGLKIGSEYTKEQINEAIKLSKSGGDPYSIVPSKDTNGHGTMVAGIAAARGINPDLTGVAPACEMIIVKLRTLPREAIEVAGITKPNIDVYGDIDIAAAIRYISIISSSLRRPIVVLLPLGNNMGAHDGTDFLSGIIDAFISQAASTVVVGTGNEGDTDTHAEGIIDKKGDSRVIELLVGKNQNTINFSIWVDKPDIMSISIISPSGEKIDMIPAKLGKVEDIKFVYEGTIMSVSYILANIENGDETINIKAVGLKEGIWRFNIFGDYIVNGKYSAWIPQRYLLDPDTKFLNPNPYTTLMNPSTAKRAISVAYYNQNNDSVVGASGRGYTLDNRVKPDIAAGGINATIIKPGGGTGIASGSSIATAIVAGICTMLFQWAIVDGNDPRIFSEQLMSYIIRGANMRVGDTYPNREWGYGTIDVTGILNAIRGEYGGKRGINESYEYTIGELFIRLPDRFEDIDMDEVNFFDKEQI